MFETGEEIVNRFKYELLTLIVNGFFEKLEKIVNFKLQSTNGKKSNSMHLSLEYYKVILFLNFRNIHQNSMEVIVQQTLEKQAEE